MTINITKKMSEMEDINNSLLQLFIRILKYLINPKSQLLKSMYKIDTTPRLGNLKVLMNNMKIAKW